MHFETEHLILRPWADEDLEDLYEAAREPAVGLPCGWQPHPSLEHSRAVLEKILQNDHTWALVLKETGKAVGTLSLMPSDESELASPQEAELGAWIAVPCQGKGLVPEGARVLLQYAFETLDRTAVWAGYYDGNDRSGSMQRKLGFVPIKTLESHLVPALNEYRTLHVTCLSKERWQSLQTND